VSPTVSSVLACKSLDGDMLGGTEVDRLSPDAEIASCINGISLSIRWSNERMSEMILWKCGWFWAEALLLPCAQSDVS
jgi:hypothetical protein